MTYPKFGAAGAIEEESHAYTTEELEYRNGFATEIFDLKHVDTLRRSKPSFCAAAYGIGKSDDAAKNSLLVPLESVTLTEEEEITEPHRRAIDPGESPALGDKLTYTDGLIFMRLRKTLSINGKGDPPAGLGAADRGNTYGSAITLKPAVVGSAGPTIEEGSGWYIKSVEISDSNTDWRKFVLELTKFIPNTEAEAQANILSPDLFTITELDAISQWYKLSRTITLNATEAPNVEESAEIYDDAVLTLMMSYDDATLSGTPLIVRFTDEETDSFVYVKFYPTISATDNPTDDQVWTNLYTLLDADISGAPGVIKIRSGGITHHLHSYPSIASAVHNIGDRTLSGTVLGHTTLSGVPRIGRIDVDGVPYYVKMYPTDY